MQISLKHLQIALKKTNFMINNNNKIITMIYKKREMINYNKNNLSKRILKT